MRIEHHRVIDDTSRMVDVTTTRYTCMPARAGDTLIMLVPGIDGTHSMPMSQKMKELFYEDGQPVRRECDVAFEQEGILPRFIGIVIGDILYRFPRR